MRLVRGLCRVGIAVGVATMLAVLVAPVAASSAPAPDDQPTLRVAVHPVPPFVVEDADGDLTGFSVELVRAIGDKAGLTIEFVVVENVQAQLDAVASGEADAAIGAISITAEREAQVDFSQPVFDSGIQIAVPEGAPGSAASGLQSQVFTSTLLAILAIAVGGTVLFGALIWWFERRKNRQFARDGRGVFDGIWWATETLFAAIYGDRVPRRAISRLLAAVWMAVSVLLVATLIAEVTTNRTVERLDAEIESVGDLYGQDVVTVRGTTSAAFLSQNGIDARLLPRAGDAFAEVAEGSADAFVFDAAVLRYLIASSDGGVRLSGPVLRSESYGIALPDGSEAIEPVNQAILRLQELGTFDRLVSAYFG